MSCNPASGRGGRIRKGCVGCVFVVGALLIGIGVALYLMLRGGPVLPAETFLAPSAEGFAIFQLCPENGDLVRMFQPCAGQLAERLDLEGRDRELFLQAARRLPDKMDVMTPVRCILLLRTADRAVEGEAQENAEAAPWAVSQAFSSRALGGWGRLKVKMLIARCPDEGGHVEAHRGVDIGVRQDGTHVAAVENNFLFAADMMMMKAWIESIEKQQERLSKADEPAKFIAPFEGHPALGPLYRRLERGAPVRAAVVNEGAQIRRLLEAGCDLEELGPNPKLRDTVRQLCKLFSRTHVGSDKVQAAGVQFRMIAEDTGLFELYVRCDAEESAEALQKELLTAFGRIAEKLEGATVSGEADGQCACAKLSLSGLQGILRRWSGKEESVSGDGQ